MHKTLLAMLIILPMAMVLVSTGGGGAGTLPLSFTFIVKAPILNTYQAFISGGSPTIPLYQESNFTKLINDDIENGGSCTPGCSVTMSPGSFNQTQTIQITKNIAFIATPATIIFSQPTFKTADFNISSTSFTFSGGRVDDFARRFIHIASCSNNSIISQVSCNIPFVEYGSNCNINNAQMFNITASAVYLTRLSSGCNISFNTIIGLPSQFANASQPAMVGILGSGSSHHITNNIVSYFHGGAAIQIGAGTINNSVHNFAVENTLFHNEYGVQTNAAIDAHINDNTIYNSTSYGIEVKTGLIPSTFGPLTITGNNLGESGQGLCCGSVPGAEGHIQLDASRCCWYSVAIVGNTMLDRNTTLTTKTDIEVTSQNYRNLTITGNSVGKTINPITILLDVAPPDRSWIITANPGFNAQPVRGPLTAGATPFTYTNNDAYMEQIEIITTGDMTGLTCRGVAQIIAVDELTPVLNTLDTCVFTYVVTAPTYDVLPLQG